MVAFASTFVDGESKVHKYGQIDFQALGAHVANNLPSYARPFFVRILDSMEVTGKHVGYV